MQKHKHNKNQKGFTLIELLVVIAIIAVLSSAVMAALQSSRLKAYDAQITSDMGQVKNALELYANDNGYVYPNISMIPQTGTSSKYVVHPNTPEGRDNGLSRLASVLSVKKAIASGRNLNCINFDNLENVLVPKYISKMPRHPLDDDGDICYKYFSSPSADIAVAYSPLITEIYSSGINKQIGAAVGKTDVADLSNICAANVAAGAIVNSSGSANSPFPLFDGAGGDHCQGSITDIVIGITSGEGDITTESVTPRCTDPQYTTQSECEANHSYCSDPQYNFSEPECVTHSIGTDGTCSDPQYNGQQYYCVNNGYYSGGYCSDSSYTEETPCIQNGYTVGGGCSGGGYSDQESCVHAGYLLGGGCSNGSYYDQVSCLGAGYCSSGSYYDQASCTSVGYCSNGSYTDKNSCETGGHCSGEGFDNPSSCTSAGYCSQGGYPDQDSCISAGSCSSSGYYDSNTCENAGSCTDSSYSDPESCNLNGHEWKYYGYHWEQNQWTGYGYIWINNNYSWTPNNWTSLNNSWSDGDFYSHNYTWDPGNTVNNTWYPGTVWTANTWTEGNLTQNTWTYIPPNTWGIF